MTQLREDHVLPEVAPLLRLAKSTDLPEGVVEKQQQHPVYSQLCSQRADILKVNSEIDSKTDNI